MMRKTQNFEKGVVVTLAIFVLSAILVIAFGSSALLLRELGFARESRFYVRAFFAADTGIEKILTLREDPLGFSECTSPATACTLSNGAEYWVIVTQSGDIKPDGSTCLSDNYCIESIGKHRGTRRAIEVNY